VTATLEQSRFVFVCRLYGFNLPAFDAFADALPDGEGRRELLNLRAEALRAFKRDDELALRGWLHAMATNWRARKSLEHYRPIVAIGAPVQQGSVNAKRKAEHTRADREVKWQAALDEAYRANPHQSLTQLRDKAAGHCGLTSRRQIERAGLMPRGFPKKK
jgi:hypothetical protein